MKITRPLTALVLAAAALTACGTSIVTTTPEALRVQSAEVAASGRTPVTGSAAPVVGTGTAGVVAEVEPRVRTAPTDGTAGRTGGTVPVAGSDVRSGEGVAQARRVKVDHGPATVEPDAAPRVTEQPVVTLPAPVTSDETDPESYPPAPDFVSATPTVERAVREVAEDRGADLPAVSAPIVVERAERGVNPDRAADPPVTAVTVSDVP